MDTNTEGPLNLQGEAGADDGFHPLDPRHITVDKIAGLIFSAVVAVGAVIGLAVLAISRERIDALWIWIAIGAAVATGLLFFFSLYWPPIEYRYSKWRLDDVGLEIRRGVFWQHQVSVPIARVQHADVSQGPLQRSYELGKLTVHTAGTQNASVELNGLAFTTATELRNQLIRGRNSIDVT